jgi:multidrug efflux pump subunit AcrA (membrane-fusion protein)
MKRLLSALLILPLSLACVDRDQKAVEQPEANTPVRIAQIQEKRVVTRLHLAGEIVPLWKVDLYSNTTGKVIEKRAHIGDTVKKSQILARLMQDVPGMEYAPAVIEAPAAGCILADPIEEGTLVTQQRPVYTLARLDSVLVNARVLESDWVRLRTGSRCLLRADALPGHTFAGQVRKLLPQVDTRSRTGSVEIIVANTALLLTPGMSVECTFETGTRTALVVPLDALIRNGAGYRTVKIVDGRARFITLAAGEITGQEMITGGPVAVNDTVVVYGQNLLQDGARVEIAE